VPAPRSTSRLVALALSVSSLVATPALAGLRGSVEKSWGLLGPQPELDELSWLIGGVHESRPLRLVPDRSLPLLRHYLAPSQNHVPEWRTFYRGAYGAASWSPRFSLSWGLGSLAPEPFALSVSANAPCPRWRAPRPVHLARYDGSERATLPLLDCEGGIAPDALDVVSVLSRAPGAVRPELPLPLEPAPDAPNGEWLPSVKLLEPRLLWVLDQVAQAFPRRTLYIMSGYRQGGHGSLHGKGRALDLFVQGVENERLFALCRSLRDVGCGYYPRSKFVHIDVRPYGTDRVLWVDDSAPGAASRYLDGYPGVLEPGIAWVPS
jgi:Bacterial protein of unknown function (DUF882)